MKMDHLEEAKRLALSSADADISVEWSQVTAMLATTHVLIAIAERLPPPAEKWSETHARLRQEERTQEEDRDGV